MDQNQITRASEKLAAANAEFEKAADASRRSDEQADRDRQTARDKLDAVNSAQAQWDFVSTEMRRSAPDHTNWKAGA